MKKIKFINDGGGWYHTDTDIFRYTIRKNTTKQWFIYESPIGKNFGTHIATAERINDAKAWLRKRIAKETLLQ